MIFKNIDFHNVEEIEETEHGYQMWRIPKTVRDQVNDRIRTLSARYSTGIELRFRVRSGSARISLYAPKIEEAQVAYIYYGSFQGGWRYSSKVIHEEETVIEIPRPENLDVLYPITEENGLGFSPELVRLVLPYGICMFVGAEGDIAPPGENDVPSKTYLAYGSSITHGSLALAAPYAYPFRIAQKLKYDSLNLGFAGSARLEKAMAEYIVSRSDWDIASVEMGINMLGEEFDEALFEERVDVFTRTLADDPRPVFATSIFTHYTDNPGKTEQYREIVRKYAKDRLIFTEGETLMDSTAYLSQDLTHPSLEGIEQIASNWHAVMAAELERQRR